MKKTLLSILIASSLLLSACSSVSGTMSTTTTTTATETTESPIPKFTQTPTESTQDAYDFTWNNEMGKEFDGYCKKNLVLIFVDTCIILVLLRSYRMH